MPHLRSLVLSLLALALIASACSSAPVLAAGPGAETAAAKRLVVAPSAGRVVGANHVRIRVRSPRGAVLRVRLNGVRVGKDFSRARRGVRTLRASLSHGLRRGRNVLRVRVGPTGARAHAATVRFRVQRPRELVGAGRDRTLVVGNGWRLDGRVLRAVGNDSAVGARWRVVGAPRKSRARVLLNAPARLGGGFRPDVPGRYTLRLAAGGGPTKTTDVVQMDVVPQARLINLDTMAGTPANPEIAVGGSSYPLAGATGSGPMQVLVLTRKNLEFISNTRYAAAVPLGTALGELSVDKLAIVAWQGQGAVSGDLDAALAKIGWPKLGPIPAEPGSVSAIGVSGMKRGDADMKLDAHEPGGPPRAGRIQGYLSPDQNGAFGFVASDRIPFKFTPSNSRPPDTPSECGATCAGLLVRFQNRYTLETDMIRYYALGDPTLSAGTHNAEAASMVNSFQQHAGEVLTIRTVSTPQADGTYLPPVGPIDRPALRQVVDLIVDAGGTRNAFNSIARKSGAAASKGSTYTLVGWKGAGEGEGAEVAAGVEGASPAPLLTGVMRPDREMEMRPANVKETTDVTDRLSTVMLEPPTFFWPLENNHGAMAALSWLGSKDSRLGPNPRTAYWRQDFAVVGTWTDLKLEMEKVAYEAGHGFTKADFKLAQKQLVEELELVFKVHSYVRQLSTVFQSGGQAWAQTHVIADDIYKAIKPPDEETTLSWIEFAEILLHLAGPATKEATAEVAGILELGVWAFGAMSSGAPTYDEFAVEADELGAELEKLAASSGKAVQQMGDIVVSDWAKLKLVGTHALCDPGEGCPDGWSFDGENGTEAAADIERSIQRIAYAKFIPMAYSVFNLARSGNLGGIPSIKRSSPPANVEGYITVHGGREWPNAPEFAYASALEDLDPSGLDNLYQTWILHIPSLYGRIEEGYPPPEMLEHMFKPVPDTNSAADDGLGMSLAEMARSVKPKWFWGSEAEEEKWTRWIH